MTTRVETIDGIAKQLARAKHVGDISFISTPVMLPNGSTVVVRVQQAIEGFLVTDYGLGYDEVELINGNYFYGRVARKIAEDFGVHFDEHSFFSINVSEGQLIGAITTIANCVQFAVTQVFQKVEDAKIKKTTEKLHQKLGAVFSPNLVAKDYHIRGESNHEWRFDAMVKTNENMMLFEYVSKSHYSVVSTMAKFQDIARNNGQSSRISVINKTEQYGDYLSLLTQNSKVVELNAANDTYQNLGKVS